MRARQILIPCGAALLAVGAYYSGHSEVITLPLAFFVGMYLERYLP